MIDPRVEPEAYTAALGGRLLGKILGGVHAEGPAADMIIGSLRREPVDESRVESMSAAAAAGEGLVS